MAQAHRRTLARHNSYSEVYPQLDLVGALSAGLDRNDLLPPRPDDRAGGEVANRFVAALGQLLSSGRYEADRALMVPVPKPSYATRPAALLTAADRILYHALVEPLRARIERGLVSDRALFWPRAETVPKQWTRFEAAPMELPGLYIVRTDVGGFYETIDHDLLGERLTTLTGKTALVDVLIDFLGQIMDGPRGLPQGLSASDVLATAFLSPVDAGMLRYGHAYWRHGDDVRMTVQDHDSGRRAVHQFEGLLRSVRLLMNADKTRVLLKETYERHGHAVEEERARVKRELAVSRERALLDDDVPFEEVESLVERAGIDEQTQWNLFYHENISLEDIVDQLRPHLEPDDITVATNLYSEAVRRAPDADEQPLSPEMFHGMLSSSLTTLIAARDSRPLADIASLLARFPSETELLVTYLRALVESHPIEVVREATAALSASYTTGWQQGWLLGVIREVLEKAPDTDADTARNIAAAIAADEEASWLARAEAARLLGSARALSRELLSRLWSRAPAAVRGDLAAAVAAAATPLREAPAPAWAEAFRDSLRDDPLLQVVLNRAG